MRQVERDTSPLTDEGRYRLLVNAVVDYAIFMLDVAGQVATWNEGARRLKGYEASDIIGRHFSCFYTDDDRAAALPDRALREAERDGKFEHEGWRVRQDGSRFWASVVIDPIRDPTGILVGYAKITRDLSERRLAESTLRHSEEQFRLLVQSVTDYAIFMLDPEGRITTWNQGAGRIKGYRPEEIIGKHFSCLYTPEDRGRNEPQRSLAAALSDGRFEDEGWRVRRNGKRFWAHVVIDPIRNDDGSLYGFAKVTRDITQTREAQQELNDAREALFQSQKIEAVGRLTGGVAHDFNNLLMAISGSLELLRKHVADNPKLVALADNGLQGTQRGAALTQRMLSFARRQTLDPKAVEIPKLVSGMADLLQRSLGPLVTIETRFPLVLDAVEVDPNQLELALLNLAMNARDAMPEGGPITLAAQTQTVAVGERRGLKPGRYVCLSVVDCGEGMDEETVAKAAEPFFTTKGVGKGTGLGLSMVHGAALQSKGRLILKSRKGQGTTAELWLPAAQDSAKAAAYGRPNDDLLAGPEMSPLVVLAVDDDHLVLRNTVAMLEDMGHRSLPAASGQEALDILRQDRPIDLVITDHAMPNMTGAKLARSIKADWPNLPIILATGYAELTLDDDATLPRLAKPFRQIELARAIAAAVRLS